MRVDPDERQHRLLHRDELVEVYVVCWMDGHDTGFHDHDDSAAAMRPRSRRSPARSVYAAERTRRAP